MATLGARAERRFPNPFGRWRRSADQGPQDSGRGLTRLTAITLVLYLVFIVGMMVMRRASVTPDVFAVFALAVAVIAGRGRTFVRDWLPFIAILLAWQAMRGFAWQVGFPVQSDGVIAIERALFFGVVPTIELQRIFHVEGQVQALDVSMALVYLLHFAGTLTLAFILWLKDRSLFLRFAAVLLVLSYMQFITAILLPVAPPRYAWVYGEDLHVVDIAAQVGRSIGFHTLSWTYQHMNANPVAAMPSLHAAYPIAAALVVSARWPRVAIGLAAYGAVVWFSIVYLGHHYVVDALVGALYALVAYFLVRSFSAWTRERRRRSPVQLQLQPARVRAREGVHMGTVDRGRPEP